MAAEYVEMERGVQTSCPSREWNQKSSGCSFRHLVSISSQRSWLNNDNDDNYYDDDDYDNNNNNNNLIQTQQLKDHLQRLQKTTKKYVKELNKNNA